MPVNSSGFSGNKNPETTNWLEHSAVGDVSTGRRFKAVQEIPMLAIVDEASATVTYVGETKPGTSSASALWRIRKITESGTITTVAFADGDDQFDNVWDDRASLSYS